MLATPAALGVNPAPDTEPQGTSLHGGQADPAQFLTLPPPGHSPGLVAETLPLEGELRPRRTDARARGEPRQVLGAEPALRTRSVDTPDTRGGSAVIPGAGAGPSRRGWRPAGNAFQVQTP